MPSQVDRGTPLDPNFSEAIDLLNSRAVPYWVCHGSLLGLIRDGELIPWDHDIDIAVWAEETPKSTIIELMTAHGYSLKNDGADYDFLQFTKKGGREVDYNFYRISSDSAMAYSEWPIPRSVFTRLCDVLANARNHYGKGGRLVRRLGLFSPIFRRIVSFLKKRGLFYTSAGYTTPAGFLKAFEFVEISGLRVRMPSLHESVLAFVYGQNWRVPKQNYNWQDESPSTRVSNDRFNREG